VFYRNFQRNFDWKRWDMQRREKIERTDYCFVVLQCTGGGGGGLKPHIIVNAAHPRALKIKNLKFNYLPVIWR
jgi:hypothetical protein